MEINWLKNIISYCFFLFIFPFILLLLCFRLWQKIKFPPFTNWIVWKNWTLLVWLIIASAWYFQQLHGGIRFGCCLSFFLFHMPWVSLKL